ncbi:hypothetical protein IE81DRAFT_349909 [Ceraceosorus guamensis]|uniref:Vacuolar protein sorting-associated protein 51 homolog n=1 Tax=Ceraceosorus guamensis TaxID=1522189 RepID=A0A316VQX8_9BASI|nr:hypothetical protein IE81DRAFT_349909 [Ceraceosorus guamensis]PWN39750.1 hypothetical protein IE81DRAFT_349909 [Ceraceosorus guamensis]
MQRTGGRVGSSALRDYYGLAASASNGSSSAGAAVASSSSSPLDPDSINFSPSLALEDLRRTKNAAGLMNDQARLLTEIRELDGERQSLVYNHHHELVAASETIRKMKTRADDLTPSLDALRASLTQIDKTRAELSLPEHLVQHKSSGRDQEGQQARAIERVVELPTRLRDCIALERTADEGLAAAERLWGQSEAVLSAWDEAGVHGVKEVASECREVLREARARVSGAARG